MKSTADWLALFESGGLPAGPVSTITEMHQDPQTQAREMVVSVDHPVAGQVNSIGLPIKFSETPGGVACAAPLLGQHTAEILGEIGYTPDEIERIKADGAAIFAKEIPA